jgi:hypothetical protein
VLLTYYLDGQTENPSDWEVLKSSDNNEQSDPTAVQYFTAFGKRWGTRPRWIWLLTALLLVLNGCCVEATA